MTLALAYVHQGKVLHRDLKTQNIFLTRECKVIKLGDFGISKVLDGTIDMAKTVIGTPYYMSPELCENQPYGMQSDVWALGCILYEMCVLKHAFDATNICGLIFKILNGSYPPISDQYSEDLRGLVSKMLSREPKDRPALTQILKMPLITNIMAELREDLSKGSRSKGSPKKKTRSNSSRATPRHAKTATGGGGGAIPGPSGGSVPATPPPKEPLPPRAQTAASGSTAAPGGGGGADGGSRGYQSRIPTPGGKQTSRATTSVASSRAGAKDSTSTPGSARSLVSKERKTQATEA